MHGPTPIEPNGAAVMSAWPLPAKLGPRIPWSEREKDILREHYPKGGMRACMSLLPLRTECMIYWKAGDLGLKAPRQSAARQRWTTTPHIDEAIKRAYIEDGRKGMLARLSRQIQRPAEWISSRARALGVVPPRFREPPWSDTETAMIITHAAKQPHSISRILLRRGYRRTATAIVTRLNRLRVDRTDEEHYTSRGLGDLMGCGQTKVARWIEKGWLKAKRKSDLPGSEFKIHRKEVRRFIIENVSAVDLRRVDKFWFVELVANGEARSR